MFLLATNLILSPDFHFRYEKVPPICRRLLMPIGDDHGNVKGYFIPLTDFGKASKMTLDGAMHVRIFRPDLVIMLQFLEAATRKMVTCNAMVNAQNGNPVMQNPRRENSQGLYCVRCRMCMRDSKRSCHHSSAGQWRRGISRLTFLAAGQLKIYRIASRSLHA